MTVRRLVAIIFIFGCVTFAWVILGTSVISRTNSGFTLLDRQVQGLWGTNHLQKAPQVILSSSNQNDVVVEFDSSDIVVGIQLDHRRKGLLWYATYDVLFSANYSFHNPLDENATTSTIFSFPSSGTIYDDFDFRVGEIEITPRGNAGQRLEATLEIPPGAQEEIHLSYKSRGVDSWYYSFSDQITTVKNFSLTLKTDFDTYDFPGQTISASTKTKTSQGWELEWQFENLISDFDLGIEMPNKLNPSNLQSQHKYQNLNRDYNLAIRRLHDLGVMVNASFVFGMDHDNQSVFERTVAWAIEQSIETATFHILTPYPGTVLHQQLGSQSRITSQNWDLYDTRHVVFQPASMSVEALETGYWRAYQNFYKWGSIFRGAWAKDKWDQRLRHLAYSGGWKKFEPLWDWVIQLKRVGNFIPLLETILSSASSSNEDRRILQSLGGAAYPQADNRPLQDSHYLDTHPF